MRYRIQDTGYRYVDKKVPATLQPATCNVQDTSSGTQAMIVQVSWFILDAHFSTTEMLKYQGRANISRTAGIQRLYHRYVLQATQDTGDTMIPRHQLYLLWSWIQHVVGALGEQKAIPWNCTRCLKMRVEGWRVGCHFSLKVQALDSLIMNFGVCGVHLFFSLGWLHCRDYGFDLFFHCDVFQLHWEKSLIMK